MQLQAAYHVFMTHGAAEPPLCKGNLNKTRGRIPLVDIPFLSRQGSGEYRPKGHP